MSKVEYKVTLDAENGIVRIVVRGEFDKALGEEIVTRARTVAAEHQYHILCDVRNAEAAVNLADWFFLPRTLAVLKNAKTRIIRTAVLISPGNQKSVYDFYETVTFNVGMKLRIFLSEENAVEWLTESS